ncbi:MAG: PAS domain S-box protein [Burkholderiales bacterium]|nr:PAS domain S-box protein [Burkholderiales bacterium]
MTTSPMMVFLSRFFADGIDPGLLLYGTYNPWLVALSVLVAVFSSSMGLHAAYQARGLVLTRLRQLSLLAGSLSLGCGVWAMHFIGMLAFQVCTQVSYHIALTLLSVLPSLGASWVALNLLSQPTVTRRQLWISGTLVGAGIGAMHYTGMAAMQMAAVLRYNPWIFGLSLLVAVGLAVLALWVRFGLATFLLRGGALIQTSVSGVVMGLAIAGMHYTGMAAARFIGHAQNPSGQALYDPVPLALSITLVTLVASSMVAAAIGLTRYRQIVRQLRVKEARLRAISDTSMDAIIVFDEQGIVHEFNPGAERIYGWRAADIIGHSVTDIIVEPFRTPAKIKFANFLRQIASILGHERETHGVRRDGSLVPIRLVIARMPKLDQQLYVAYVSDISERQTMQAALQESEAQFRSLIANIPGISYRCRAEPGWPVVYVSDAIESITGYPARAFIGPQATMRFADLLASDEVTRLAAILKAARQEGRSFILEFQLRHRDGSPRWMWGHGCVVRSGDEAVQWVDGVLLDITERHNMEADLLQAKDKAEAAAAARSTFLANMSHEIRTPMNAILGFTEVVLAGDLPAGPRKHLETVYKSARSLLHLLNDILDTSKLERGVVELESLDFSVPELVQQLCAEQSLAAQRKRLQLQVHIRPDVGDMVCGDPYRLRQVLLNLLGNAIKFTHQGQVSLHVSRIGHDVVFDIRDTGIGIPSERLPHIFEAFTQADTSMSRHFGGSGLGTTISKQLVDLMHGRIWVDSVVGQGSTFHVQVPLPQRQVAHIAPPTQPGTPHVLPPLRILAVDDVWLNIELIQLLLDDQGHTIFVARNGQEALDLLRQERVDVVLMDVQMPVLDGLSACRTLRQWEQEQGWPHTPVIALSASVQAEDRKAALAAGMDGFAGKPLDLDKLLDEISRITGVSPVPDPRLPAAPLPLPDRDKCLIDTERAHQRWGDVGAYQQSLHRFAQDNMAWAITPGSVATPADALTAARTAHRLRGAAANLALLAVERAAQQVEGLPSQPATTASPSLDAAWAQLQRAMQETLAAIAHQPPAAPPSPAPQPALPATTTDELSTWRQQADSLRTAFLRGERLDGLLQQFCQTIRPRVPAQPLQALEQAVEDFDFEAAAASLDRLIHSLPATGDEHAAL